MKKFVRIFVETEDPTIIKLGRICLNLAENYSKNTFTYKVVLLGWLEVGKLE